MRDGGGGDLERARKYKSELRETILRTRRELAPERHAAEADALRAAIACVLRAGMTVCAYVPIGSEPGSLAMLDAITAAEATVLLPVARNDSSGNPQPLSWAGYTEGGLVDGRFGLREPAPPWLPADAVASASLILVPALAVDRAGVRLGRGAGFYDRSLPLADPTARLVAVVRDDELVDSLPGEDHDVPMTHALTPGRGLVALGPST
jgi:5-formyltetrahydrofolate cyclo-ligase